MLNFLHSLIGGVVWTVLWYIIGGLTWPTVWKVINNKINGNVNKV